MDSLEREIREELQEKYRLRAKLAVISERILALRDEAETIKEELEDLESNSSAARRFYEKIRDEVREEMKDE